MPIDIDQDLIGRTPGGIAVPGMGGGGGGMAGGLDLAGLLDGLLGAKGIAPAGANGAISPMGEALTGPPVMGAGQRQGGLLAGLGSSLGPGGGGLGGGLSRLLGRRGG